MITTARLMTFAVTLSCAACTTAARPVSQATLAQWLPFIQDGVTTSQELHPHLGEPEWQELQGRIQGYRMGREQNRVLRRGAYAAHEQFDLIVALDSADRVRAHALMPLSIGATKTALERQDLSDLPEDISLADVILQFGRPHYLRSIAALFEAQTRIGSRIYRDIVFYGWGNTGPEEYEYGIGNVAGGYLVLQLDANYRVRRRAMVDRKRWEDDLAEGIKQTARYWHFEDRTRSN